MLTRIQNHLDAGPGQSRLAIGVLIGMATACAGCLPDRRDVAVRPEFRQYDKVAIWPPDMQGREQGGLVRLHEELFLPRWMAAFPDQSVIERRDIRVALGEQEILPGRIDDETRAKIRRLTGVKGIVFPNYSISDWCQLHIKVLDTETGQIAAAITRRRHAGKNQSVDAVADVLIDMAICDLRDTARSLGAPPR